MATSAKPQLEMVVDDPAERERARIEAERERERESADQKASFDALITACRDAALVFGGYDKTANALDAIWGRHGRQVSASFLTSTMKPESTEARSYFRLEWIIWFAQQSAEVRDLLIGIVDDAPKDPAEGLADLEDLAIKRLGETGAALVRDARAKRRRRKR